VRLLALRSTSKFLLGSSLVFGYLLFITDKMGDLSLQEPELREITRSDTDHFPPIPVRVGLALRHSSDMDLATWGNLSRVP
jgi:hypothetical protein